MANTVQHKARCATANHYNFALVNGVCLTCRFGNTIL